MRGLFLACLDPALYDSHIVGDHKVTERIDVCVFGNLLELSEIILDSWIRSWLTLHTAERRLAFLRKFDTLVEILKLQFFLLHGFTFSVPTLKQTRNDCLHICSENCAICGNRVSLI
ncbi:hypothetical protein D3C86_1451870 [compost metagenome]